MALWDRLRRWFPPKVLVPAIISAGLVVFLLGVADLRTLREMIELPPIAVASMVGLTVVFLTAKGVVWFELLRKAEIAADWRNISFAYLGGEITKLLPGGIYFQNYLLGKLSGHRAEYGVATSLVLVGMEAAVSMILVLTFGIPGWPWIRPALLGLSAFWIAILLALWRSGLVGRLEAWARGRHPLVCKAMREVDLLYAGLVKVWHPLLWLRLIALTAVYLVAYGLELWVVAWPSPSGAPLGVPGALSAGAFSLLVPMMLPVPVQLGFTEVTGTGALSAMGLSYAQAISLMFALRLWGTGLIFVLGLPAMALMRGQWRRALGPWPRWEGSEPDDRPPCD